MLLPRNRRTCYFISRKFISSPAAKIMQQCHLTSVKSDTHRVDRVRHQGSAPILPATSQSNSNRLKILQACSITKIFFISKHNRRILFVGPSLFSCCWLCHRARGTSRTQLPLCASNSCSHDFFLFVCVIVTKCDVQVRCCEDFSRFQHKITQKTVINKSSMQADDILSLCKSSFSIYPLQVSKLCVCYYNKQQQWCICLFIDSRNLQSCNYCCGAKMSHQRDTAIHLVAGG